MNARTRTFHSLSAAALLAGFLGMVSIGIAQDAPQPSPSGMTFAPVASDGLGLEIPDAAMQKGTVYHLLPGRAVQATFQSDTPIESFQGETDAIVGFAIVASPEQIAETLQNDTPAERGVLLGAEFALPVDTIRTGIDMRDRHLLTEQWLDEANHPHIRFRLAYLANPMDVTPERAPEGSRTVRGELVGDMTIRGITRPLRIPEATIALLPESESTSRVAAGDLMALRCRYTITLGDFGIDNAIVGRQVARSVEIDQVLYFSTVRPEAPPEDPDQSESSSNGSEDEESSDSPSEDR